MTRDSIKLFKIFLKKIRTADSIFIFGHKVADQDCISSQFALKLALQKLYKHKKIYVVTEPDCLLNICNLQQDFTTAELESDTSHTATLAASLGIIVDCNTIDRVNTAVAGLCNNLIVFDHHLLTANPLTAQNRVIGYVDTTCLACTGIIYRFLKFAKATIDLNIAKLLYTGTMTDSGWLKFTGVTPELVHICAELLSAGVDVTEIEKFLSKRTPSDIAHTAYICNNIQYTENNIAFCYISGEALVANNFDKTISTKVNTMRNIEGYPVYFLATELADGLHISIRSLGPSINAIAQKYGGGGHALAAGCVIKPEEFTKFVVDLAQVMHNI